jgi:polyisoprenoid-binding protein YceI
MSIATQQALPTGTWILDPVHSTAGFAVKHMVVATFRGRFDDFDARLTVADDGAVELVGTVDVDSLVVKDENLAGHLKSPDFFDSARFPQITYRSRSVRREGDELVVDGELTVKDQTRPVEGRGTIAGPRVDIAGTAKLGITLETVVDRTRFGLNWNADLPKGGKALANDVKLIVELELAQQAA